MKGYYEQNSFLDLHYSPELGFSWVHFLFFIQLLLWAAFQLPSELIATLWPTLRCPPSRDFKWFKEGSLTGNLESVNWFLGTSPPMLMCRCWQDCVLLVMGMSEFWWWHLYIRSQQVFFCKVPNSKHFSLCGPYNLCHNATLTYIVWKQPQTICNWMSLVVFQ